MNKLVQEKGFYYKFFELQEDEIYIISKDFETESEYSLDYLNLGVRTYRHAEKRARAWQWVLWLAISLGIVTLIIESIWGYKVIERGWIGGLLILSSLIILWFKLKQEPAMIHLTGGQKSLEILAMEPSEKEVKAFLDTLMDRIKQAYRNQYLENKDDVLPEEKRSRIEWLHEIKIITRSEKDVLLNKLEEEKANGIGFKVRMKQG